MAFVCSIDLERIPAPLIGNGSTFSIGELVGFDDAVDRTYSAVVTLTPLAGGEQELVFCLVEDDGEAGGEYTYWSGKDVARFISRRDRELILGVVGEATKRLIEAVRPARIFRQTMDADAPEEALRKHSFIAGVIELCGYAVTSTDCRYGRMSWWMERVEGRKG